MVIVTMKRCLANGF